MGDKRTLDEELIVQTEIHLEREERYWARFNAKGNLMSNEELEAKALLIDAIYNVGAGAALRVGNNTLTENLMWSYRSLMLVLRDTRSRLEE